MKGITTGPLEVVETAYSEYEVIKRDDPGDPWSIATFYDRPDDGTAEANARAFVMVEQMVGVLRDVVRTYGSMETGDGEPCPIVANARAILASIDGRAGHD